MRTLIVNGQVYLEDGAFHKTNLLVEGERIVSIGAGLENAEEIIDASSMYIIPGIIDLHFHGCAGYDLCDASALSIKKMVEYQRRNGITTVCPATMTLPVPELFEIMKSVKEYQNDDPDGMAGILLEGPFIHPEKCGAQDKTNCIKPDSQLFEELQLASGGAIRLVTIAPELPGAFEFARNLSENVCIAIGHSTSDYETAAKMFQSGASHVTHLYNGMIPWSHREPGIPGAAMDAPNVTVELICDGNHLHPAVIRSTFRQFGSDRIVLVSDSTMAAGLPDGTYRLGGSKVICRNKRVTTESGVLAGSASNLMDCIQKAVEVVKMPLEEVVKCATINPAKILNIDENYGSLSVGKYANIVVLNQNLKISSVIYRGKNLE